MGQVRRRPEGDDGLEVALSEIREQRKRLDRLERQTLAQLGGKLSRTGDVVEGDLDVQGNVETVGLPGLRTTVLSPGLQSHYYQAWVLPFNSELVYWNLRGSRTATSSTTNIASHTGLDADGLVAPHQLGNAAASITPEPGGGTARFDYEGTFDSFAHGNGRRPWVRLRAGQAPSRVRILALVAGSWEIAHDDSNPDWWRGSLWLGPEIDSDDVSVNIWQIDALRFELTWDDDQVCRLHSLGWSHPNIPIGWNALAFTGDDVLFRKNLDVQGTKNANIGDPDDPMKAYRFAAVEADEAGVMVKRLRDVEVGTSREARVPVPEHFARIGRDPMVFATYATEPDGSTPHGPWAFVEGWGTGSPEVVLRAPQGSYHLLLTFCRADVAADGWEHVIDLTPDPDDEIVDDGS